MNTNKYGFILKLCGVFIILTLSSNALAEYYVVYPTTCCGSPPPVVYKKKCYTAHSKKIYKKHYVKKKKVHRPVSPVVTVYYINNNPCGFGCTQPMMPTTNCCGYQVFSGTTVQHSDYYYIQGIVEEDPDMDGNTLDNDIYY